MLEICRGVCVLQGVLEVYVLEGVLDGGCITRGMRRCIGVCCEDCCMRMH